MKIDSVYSEREINEYGLKKNNIENVDYRVYVNGTKVFFFEPIDKRHLRLYSIINKESFFL